MKSAELTCSWNRNFLKGAQKGRHPSFAEAACRCCCKDHFKRRLLPQLRRKQNAFSKMVLILVAGLSGPESKNGELQTRDY